MNRALTIYTLVMVIALIVVAWAARAAGTDPTMPEDPKQLQALVSEQREVIDQQRAALSKKNRLIETVNAEMIRALDNLEALARSNRQLEAEIYDLKHELQQVRAERDRYQYLAAEYENDNQTLRARMARFQTDTAQDLERDQYGRVIVRP